MFPGLPEADRGEISSTDQSEGDQVSESWLLLQESSDLAVKNSFELLGRRRNADIRANITYPPR